MSGEQASGKRVGHASSWHKILLLHMLSSEVLHFSLPLDSGGLSADLRAWPVEDIKITRIQYKCHVQHV